MNGPCFSCQVQMWWQNSQPITVFTGILSEAARVTPPARPIAFRRRDRHAESLDNAVCTARQGTSDQVMTTHLAAPEHSILCCESSR